MEHYLESQKTASEKVTLVTVESVSRVWKFESVGLNWEKEVPFFVADVKSAGVSLTQEEYEFIPHEKKLILIGGGDPKTRDISLVYRHFFSNITYNLPFDLIDGQDVPFEGRVLNIGQIGQKLDDQNTGMVLETSSSVSLINADCFFDSIFDTHIWENQKIAFYSWYPNIPIEKCELLFDGYVESKGFSPKAIEFRVKDFVYKTKDQIKLATFSDDDGVITPNMIGKPKRRIYGRADNVDCVCLDATLDGYELSGSISIELGSSTLTGVGTNFLNELAQGDSIIFTENEVEYEFSVNEIASNTSLTIGNVSEVSTFNNDAVVSPKNPWRKKGRKWNISGHKLFEKSVKINIVQSANIFQVDDVSDLNIGDLVSINGVLAKIRRISGKKINTNINIVPTPVNGDQIVKLPVLSVFMNQKELVQARDYSVLNGPNGAGITLSENAEFNNSPQMRLSTNLVFSSVSRNVTTTATTDLRSILKPRDFIKSTNPTRPTWYEISEVYEQKIVLTEMPNFSATEQIYYKVIDACNEDTLITVNCLGIDDGQGQWVRTASDAVKHLLNYDAKIDLLNLEEFDQSKRYCNYTLSIVLPNSLGSSSPVIREVITDINNSVLGALFKTKKGISFSILNAQKPSDIEIIRSDDCLSYSVDTNQDIVNKVILSYRPHVDIFTSESTFDVIEYQNGFVDKYIGIENTLEKTVYLYNKEDAEIMAQRLAFYNSLSKSIIKIKAKNNFSHVSLGQKFYLDLNRMYQRYSSFSGKKIASVIGTALDGKNIELSLSDLGNIFNRVPSIAPDNILNYESSDEIDRIRWAYLVDKDTKSPSDSEDGLGGFIIG